MAHVPTSRSPDGYHVPEQLSMAAVLALLTVFGLLFGGLRMFGAPATVYLFLGCQALIVCLVQMWFGAVPRGASMFVGCVFLLCWVGVAMLMGRGAFPPGAAGTWLDMLVVVLVGGLLGYGIGALVAGVFLVIDLWGNLRASGKFTGIRFRRVQG